MAPYDLLLAGGNVIDVGGGHVGEHDVAIRGGRIAAVAPGLDRRDARQVVDAAGMLVTPGLVDLHTHIQPAASYWGIEPDPVAWRSGVTTWVDAGSAGAHNLEALRLVSRRFEVRVAALLNISGLGLTGRLGECADIETCDVDLAVEAVAANRDLVVGVKVRMDRFTVGAHGLEPLRRALRVAEACQVPVMAHIGYGPPDLADLLPLLRPGDIVTHCASGVTSGVLDGGRVDPALVKAYEAGVRFDIGHGAGGFAFDVLEAQMAAGLTPHTVSTDLHARSVHGPVFDLPTTMTKLLAVGMPLGDVVAAATTRPAQALGLPDGTGTLAVGAAADVAVFRLERCRFEVADAHRQRRIATQRLVNEATYVAGRRLPPRWPEPVRPWISLTDAQREALARRERAVRDLLTAPLVEPDGLADQYPRPRQELEPRQEEAAG